jgi:hypothetical protein
VSGCFVMTCRQAQTFNAFTGAVRILLAARQTDSMRMFPLFLLPAVLCALLPVGLQASTLAMTSSHQACGVTTKTSAPPPPAAQQRLFDMNGDGRDEIILVEADALYGAASVVYRVPPARAWWPAVGARLDRGG